MKEYFIVFEGVINQEATLRLVNAIQKLKGEVKISGQPGKIVIIFSSLGGNIYEGFIVASIIQNSEITILVHAVNHIDSIANVIYLAAKERTAESYAKFYLHGSSIEDRFDIKGLREALTATKTNDSRIAYFVSENSGLQLKKVQNMMRVGTTISAQEALKNGIVQQITHREIPAGVGRDEIIYIN